MPGRDRGGRWGVAGSSVLDLLGETGRKERSWEVIEVLPGLANDPTLPLAAVDIQRHNAKRAMRWRGPASVFAQRRHNRVYLVQRKYP
ncbi:hypothetical protein E4U13_000531 [Claviceps humidiphila]|uniref:Uncharacterized protein n=1 Tax=Claviceps humidiphila TaxID=1294629 RepID=A0A9P7TYT2_9HYPO|nr:hypothetical protein E4U13_000531 [Claviceps humidiphila]